MFFGVVYLLMLALFWKLKKDCLFYVSDAYVWIHVFQKQHQKIFCELAVLRGELGGDGPRSRTFGTLKEPHN